MYQALYRKYRPMTFDDVISQPHITTTLMNQIKTGKTAHAYLFTGSRGTGKTTCARIFAKAINCEHSENGNPCLECDICRDAESFALSDIIEIDAASNNSVNDARELREGAVYSPERCRYKIYIIDEVHMLSKDAFNALLKIIEEPPPHVKFIMATTELHKVLPTILSRCQRFDFRRIRTEDIAKRLLEIAEKESITLDPEAAELIAKNADGGMRDALSILDRCIAFSDNITSDIVSEAAGIAGRGYLFELCEAIADKDAPKCIDVIARLYDGSKDMQKLCEELLTQFRNIMIAIAAPDRTGVIICLPSELETIKRIASKLTLAEVMDDLDALGRCADRLSRSLSKRTDMEMCLIGMCSGASLRRADAKRSAPPADNSALLGRIAALEEKLKNAAVTQKRAEAPAVTYSSKAQVTDVSSMQNKVLKPFDRWKECLERYNQVAPAVAATLVTSQAFEYENIIALKTENEFSTSLLRSSDNKQKLLDTIHEVTGKTFTTVKAKYVKGLSDEIASQYSSGAKPDNSPTFTEAPAESGSSKLNELIKKAEENGVPVENM